MDDVGEPAEFDLRLLGGRHDIPRLSGLSITQAETAAW